jgi:hypothetical protein
VAVVVLVAVGIALVAGSPSSAPSPLDPNSTAGNGTKALVLLLDRQGKHVQTGTPAPEHSGPALLLQDQLNESDRNDLFNWVQAGHELVVADPSSELADVRAPNRVAGGLRLAGGVQVPLGSCPLPTISDATRIQPEGGTLIAGRPGRLDCYSVDGGAFLQARRVGQGVILALGAPDLWTNANLGRADNALLAADLLSTSGTSEVTILGASRIGAGDTGLFSLISPHVWELITGLSVAFAVLFGWRARRLGRPVTEAGPVVIPASELVVARANLLQEGRHRSRATAAMRQSFAARAARLLGLPRGVGPSAIAEAAASRAGVNQSSILDLLSGPDPRTDEELLRLSQDLHDTMGEISHAG